MCWLWWNCRCCYYRSLQSFQNSDATSTSSHMPVFAPMMLQHRAANKQQEQHSRNQLIGSVQRAAPGSPTTKNRGGPILCRLSRRRRLRREALGKRQRCRREQARRSAGRTVHVKLSVPLYAPLGVVVLVDVPA